MLIFPPSNLARSRIPANSPLKNSSKRDFFSFQAAVA
jgi:hypothetical protein